jgi:hypothetical protein
MRELNSGRFIASLSLGHPQQSLPSLPLFLLLFLSAVDGFVWTQKLEQNKNVCVGIEPGPAAEFIHDCYLVEGNK